MLGAGGRGAEATVLLEGRIRLDKNKTLVTQSSVRFTVLLTMQIEPPEKYLRKHV